MRHGSYNRLDYPMDISSREMHKRTWPVALRYRNKEKHVLTTKTNTKRWTFKCPNPLKFINPLKCPHPANIIPHNLAIAQLLNNFHPETKKHHRLEQFRVAILPSLLFLVLWGAQGVQNISQVFQHVFSVQSWVFGQLFSIGHHAVNWEGLSWLVVGDGDELVV